ncbi:hypothetical protein ACIA49_41715 [Kribbella sp. NPDC051587]|uniref:hypothetical protein n=1 Tax=Kribbella sp. NPDC051587 TaxID=3364119 RepID=UPI0037A96889
MNASDIAALLANPHEFKDPTSLTGQELLAELDALHVRQTLLLWIQLRLLESNPEVVATHPDLQDKLDFLRTLDLEGVSGLGS